MEKDDRIDQYENEVVPGYKAAIKEINETVAGQETEINGLKSDLDAKTQANQLLNAENTRLKQELRALQGKLGENDGSRISHSDEVKEYAKLGSEEDKDQLMLMLIRDLKSKLNNIGI